MSSCPRITSEATLTPGPSPSSLVPRWERGVQWRSPQKIYAPNSLGRLRTHVLYYSLIEWVCQRLRSVVAGFSDSGADEGEAYAEEGEAGEDGDGADEVVDEVGEACGYTAEGGAETAGGGPHAEASVVAGGRFASAEDQNYSHECDADEEKSIDQ